MRCIFIIGFCALSLKVMAQDDEVVKLGATITGNQEQPTVLYIVPWKQTSDNTILNQGLESRLSDVFNHVERSEHMREVEYFESLTREDPDAEP
jgi:hypothetical protein